MMCGCVATRCVLCPCELTDCFVDRGSCRAAGWHLLGENERVQMDATQWKAHSEELQAAGEAKAAEWAAKDEAAAKQLAEVKVGRGCVRAWGPLAGFVPEWVARPPKLA